MEYKIKQTIKPTFDYDNQILSIHTQMDGLIKKVITEQLNFKDECVRKSLIALGWTPPDQSFLSSVKNENTNT